MIEPILSICICSLFERKEMLDTLISNLLAQGEMNSVHDEIKEDLIISRYFLKVNNCSIEIFICADDRKISTGEKRNFLYYNSIGKYVCSVDDDDEISQYYVREILKAVESDPDAVALNGTYSEDGKPAGTWAISKYYPYIKTFKGRTPHYLRYHNHLSPIRRSIAIQFPFPDQRLKEDYVFATNLHNAKAIKTEVKIEMSLYHYKYNSKK